MSNTPGRSSAEPDDMPSRLPRLEPETLERLLDGQALAPTSLGAVLAAARAPGRPDEITGLHAASANFLGAESRVVDDEGEGPARTSRLVSKLLAAKAIAVAGAVLAGGVAVAASTGNLPNPLRPPHNHPTVTTTSHATLPGSSAPAAPSRSNSRTPSSSTPSAAASHSTLSPSLAALCRAWLAVSTSTPHDSPSFGPLIAAAGGPDAVEGYCTTTPSSSPTPTSTSPSAPTSSATTSTPGESPEPTGTPSGKAKHATKTPDKSHPATPTHPTGKPSKTRDPRGGTTSSAAADSFVPEFAPTDPLSATH